MNSDAEIWALSLLNRKFLTILIQFSWVHISNTYKAFTRSIPNIERLLQQYSLQFYCFLTHNNSVVLKLIGRPQKAKYAHKNDCYLPLLEDLGSLLFNYENFIHQNHKIQIMLYYSDDQNQIQIQKQSWRQINFQISEIILHQLKTVFAVWGLRYLIYDRIEVIEAFLFWRFNLVRRLFFFQSCQYLLKFLKRG